MEGKNAKSPDAIDLRMVAKKLIAHKKLFFKVLPIVFVVSCLFIISFPRYYYSDTKLAPEMENSAAGGALSSIASSFGFDLGDMQTSDAITPLLYPDLLEDNGFVARILAVQVQSRDGEIKANYHDYLKTYQKKAWWFIPIKWIQSLLPKKTDQGGNPNQYDPYYLSRKENGVLMKARKNIKIDIDKRTGVISIGVKAQDPLVCKTLTDSIKDLLQVFITEYRTNKARTDFDYYKGLVEDAKREYEKARRVYGGTADANTRVAVRSEELKMEDMENDIQLKFNTYTTLNSQLQAAKAKVQERTPAFTVIKGAAVPVKPAGPKRMIFVLIMLILATLATGAYILLKDDSQSVIVSSQE